MSAVPTLDELREAAARAHVEHLATRYRLKLAEGDYRRAQAAWHVAEQAYQAAKAQEPA